MIAHFWSAWERQEHGRLCEILGSATEAGDDARCDSLRAKLVTWGVARSVASGPGFCMRRPRAGFWRRDAEDGWTGVEAIVSG